MTGILDMKPNEVFEKFLTLCWGVGIDTLWMREHAAASTKFHGGLEKKPPAVYAELEHRWYDTVNIAPDYSIYDGREYVVDLWACWSAYSRKYLRELRNPNRHPPLGVNGHLEARLGGVKNVVDLGCGIGFTTQGLSELFPRARVHGTNLNGTLQMKIARRVCVPLGITIAEDPQNLNVQADVVFASEYFEHFQYPIAHLTYVLDTLNPRAMLVANTFGSRSIGHFDTYYANTHMYGGRAMSNLFGSTLRSRGYDKIQTKVWNARPTLWVKR